MAETIRVSAPGRACLFGEHQDYLGLPVIPCALRMRNRIVGQPRTDGRFSVTDESLGVKTSFTINSLDLTGDDFDYLRAVVRVLLRQGCEIGGAKIRMSSDVPMKSGLSSSAAMLVSWAKFLDEAYGLGHDPMELGLACYRAEHDELGIPCGMMDQISSSLGGIIHLECTDPPDVERLPAELGELVLGDTLVHKRTIDVHGVRTREMSTATAELERLVGEPVDLRTVEWSSVEGSLSGMDPVHTKRLTAAILNRDITKRALKLLAEKHPDQQTVGELLLEQQTLLRDQYEVSHPRIDELIEAGLSAGALGGKLTGAGLGGFVVLLAPGCQEEVSAAIQRAGGRPYVSGVDEGARRE